MHVDGWGRLLGLNQQFDMFELDNATIPRPFVS
jgi:hypothetical protein